MRRIDFIVFAAILMVGCAHPPASGSGPGTDGAGPSSTGGADTATNAGARVKPPGAGELARVTNGLGDGVLRASIFTSEGTIECQLFEDAAPMTVANFVGLARGMREWVDPASDEVVERPLYRDLEFHRVLPEFAVQTGDPTGTGHGGPGYVFADEFSAERRHDRAGVLSMANHGPNTNGSQFFITLKPTAHLDFRHTVFGQCDNIEVVRAIAAAPTGPDDRPNDPPTLERIEIYRDSN